MGRMLDDIYNNFMIEINSNISTDKLREDEFDYFLKQTAVETVVEKLLKDNIINEEESTSLLNLVNSSDKESLVLATIIIDQKITKHV